MNILAVNWTATGSIFGGAAALAAFLTIAATVVVYYFQSRGDKAATIRQDLQFLHGQQVQVLPSIESGILAIIDRQIREFRERLGSTATSSYFLDELFGNIQLPGNDQLPGNRSLFRASAMNSNLSSTTYSRMSDIWDGINMRAFEFRGALRIFSYACEVLTEELRRLCGPDFTTSILDTMARRGDRAALSKIESLDELVNKLLTDHIELANRRFKDVYKETIGQGCFFIGMLTDLTLGLSDKALLKLSHKNVQQPTLDLFKANPSEAISASMGHLLPELSEQDLSPLRKVLKRWGPAPVDARPAGSHPPK